MNNQLRKIVEQAVSAVDIVTGNEALDDELAKMYIPDCFVEKFAELIVRECANQCDLLLDHKISSEWARGTHDCSKAIKKHFGVEE
jgi:hypothetical protein